MLKGDSSTIRSSVKWVAIGQYGSQIGNVVITLLLVRLLAPEAFGLLAMVTIFSQFSRIILDFGFKTAIIAFPDLSRLQLNSIFWINVVLGGVISILLYAIGPWVAAFYGEPEVTGLMRFIAPVYFLACLNVVQSGLLSRDKQFKAIAVRQILADIIGGVVGVVLAFLDYGVYSLIWQMLIGNLIGNILLWKASSWRPNLEFSFSSIQQVFKFSNNLFWDSALSYLVRNLDSLLIGKLYSPALLGLYNKSFSFIGIPQRNLASIINKAMLPYLIDEGKLNNPDRGRKGYLYLKTLTLIGLIVTPFMLAIAINPEGFVLFVFGKDWLAATPYIALFSITGIFTSMESTTRTSIVSTGNSAMVLRYGFINRMLTVAGILLGIMFSPLYVAAAICFSKLISLGLHIYGYATIGPLTQAVQYRTFVHYWWIAGLISVLLATVVHLPQYSALFGSGVLSFLVSSVILGVLYVLALWLKKDKMFTWAIGLASGLLRKRFGFLPKVGS